MLPLLKELCLLTPQLTADLTSYDPSCSNSQYFQNIAEVVSTSDHEKFHEAEQSPNDASRLDCFCFGSLVNERTTTDVGFTVETTIALSQRM